MVLEDRLKGKFKRIIAAGALSLATLLPARARAQDWPEPTNLGAPMNTAGAELNPERSCDGLTLMYDRKGTDPNATRIDGRKLYKVTYNPATQQMENEQPYDLAISDPAVPDASESDLTVSCDGRSEVMVRWGSRGYSLSALTFIQRPARGAPPDSITQILENWDGANPQTQEMSPTISDDDNDSTNGFTLHFIRYCNFDDGWVCQNTATGVYRSTFDGSSFSTPVRVSELDALIDPDQGECPPDSTCTSAGLCDGSPVSCTPNGRIVSIGMLPDGSAAIVGYIPAPADTNVRGDTDLAVIPYDSTMGRFDVANAQRLHAPDQSIDVNTPEPDTGASLYRQNGQPIPSIYYNTTHSWTNAQGGDDLYVTPVPPPPCIPTPPVEVSANGSLYPLQIRSASASNLEISVEDITPADPCGDGYNIVIGSRAVASPPAFSATATSCHLTGTPDGAGRRTFTISPTAGTPLECFLVSYSTRVGESPLGYSSGGTEIPPPTNPPACGPMP